MVKAATYIDIAVADRFTDDFEFATYSRNNWAGLESDRLGMSLEQIVDEAKQDWAGDAYRIHYLVVKSLKAKSDKFFHFSGMAGELLSGGAIGNLKLFFGQQDLANWQGPGVCDLPIMAEPGVTYLVFRDANGRLLRTDVPVWFHGRFVLAGPAVVPIGGPQDAWLKTVRAALAQKSQSITKADGVAK